MSSSYGSNNTNSSGSNLRVLLSTALTGPLPPAQYQQFLDEWATDPNLVLQHGLTPAKLPELVENNPAIATQVLIKLRESSGLKEYLDVLLKMNMSLHCLEAVVKFITAVEIPKEFIHAYISNCMIECVNTKDHKAQCRLVRLLCVFLECLIQNKTIKVTDCYKEVEDFCNEFPRIEEADKLLVLLTRPSKKHKSQHPV